jgi:hypothetical protein
MSISLPERAKALHTRLIALDHLEDNVKEARLLADLRSQLEPEAAALSRAFAQRNLLSAFGIEVVTPPSLDIARHSAAALFNKFKTETKASTLKKGVGWTKLIEQTKVASRDLGSAIMQGWYAYRQTLFTGEAPSVIKGRIAFTPSNAAAFTKYSQRYEAFRSASENVPADGGGIENIRVLAAALTEAAQVFDFDVPLEVKLFLEAIQGGGATLDLVTTTVVDWLKSNNAFDSYRIVPRSADGRR